MNLINPTDAIVLYEISNKETKAAYRTEKEIGQVKKRKRDWLWVAPEPSSTQLPCLLLGTVLTTEDWQD